ncbi:hypothetical protein BASA81_008577 [Batrachochytrium salamandrivorans]|nr:hypothetical protein BASA81_008577 [Batrachochytrium salamandrivorans]
MLQSFVSERFPKLVCGFGYGSGVFKQSTASVATNHKKKKMVDTILVVDNAQDWHENNRMRNPGDYSFLPRRCFQASTIAHIQEHYGGKIWFNTLVPYRDDMLMKYGVVTYADLLRDLNEWETFYLAGRLQKPVLELECSGAQRELHQAMQLNRLRAYQLCKRTHPQSDNVFEQIVQLSYAGDVRVGVAESPTKIVDIVAGSREHFHQVYDGLMDLPEVSLPKAYLGLTTEQVHAKLRSTIQRTSAVQTLKGILTAGLGKSFTYATDKLLKRWQQ